MTASKRYIVVDEIHRTKKVFVLLPGQLDAIRRDISIEWADVEKEEVHP